MGRPSGLPAHISKSEGCGTEVPGRYAKLNRGAFISYNSQIKLGGLLAQEPQLRGIKK